MSILFKVKLVRLLNSDLTRYEKLIIYENLEEKIPFYRCTTFSLQIGAKIIARWHREVKDYRKNDSE